MKLICVIVYKKTQPTHTKDRNENILFQQINTYSYEKTRIDSKKCISNYFFAMDCNSRYCFCGFVD